MTIRSIAVAAILFGAGLVASGQTPREKGLVALWTFDEGTGEILHDRSGRGNDGRIVGARWIPNGIGYALEFDGLQAHVDFGAPPALDLRKQLSLVAWVWAETQRAAGEPGILGKAYESYGLTQYGEKVYGYIGGGGSNVNDELPFGRWNHVAVTCSGKALSLYVNGALVKERERTGPIPGGGKFWMGRSDGAVRWTRDAHFRGRLAEARVYNRALSAEEVRHLMRTTNLTQAVDVSCVPLPLHGKLLADLDIRGFGDAAAIEVELAVSRAGADGRPEGAPLLTQKVSDFADFRAVAALSPLDPPAGRYVVSAVALREGRPVGVPTSVGFDWSPATWFPRGVAGARKLNNLVTELLHAPGSDASAATHPFVNPRLGWVYIRNEDSDEATLRRDGAPPQKIVLATRYGGGNETMRYLPAGRFTITVPRSRNLVVRAVPELIYAEYASNPIVTEFGPFAGPFRERYVEPHVNTFVDRADERDAQAWKARGGRWLVHCTVPRGTDEKPLTVEDAVEFLTKQGVLGKPCFDGLIADEFGDSEPLCRIWAAAFDRVLGLPEFAGKAYYPYANALWNGAEGRELVAALVKRESGLAWKNYLKTPRTELAAWKFAEQQLLNGAQAYREHCPGVLPRLTVCFGYFSAPPETLDTFPHVDYRTWLEMQVNLAATHPAFEDLGGLMSYLANYADEETVRWMARLFRHYGIEGRTEYLGKDPYIMAHLQDGDFEKEGQFWTLSPAEEGAIRFGVRPGFGWLAGRYPMTAEGDTAIILRRPAKKPNTFAQEIRNLEPGRLYSFRMYSGDFNDLSVKQVHAVSVSLENADVLEDRSFTHQNANCYSHAHPPFDATNKAWMNYHWRVFRAKEPTARVTVSDWKTATDPGGPIGQELLFNFLKVQPYYAPEP